MPLTAESVQTLCQQLLGNLEQVIIGKRSALELVVIGLLSEGHILIEDVPGVGKTMLARSLAQSVSGAFSRIQFTPDLLPSDITGTSVYNQMSRQFEFLPGPIMTGQIVLADEINRAAPKTQSALLEAMEERQVTVDGVAHALARPFMVIGTQNPVEYEGTFPLPEAQLDRFLLRVNLGYPAKNDERKILASQQFSHPLQSLTAMMSQADVLDLQAAIRQTYVSPPVEEYIVEIVAATRIIAHLYLGASPRGSLGLYRAGQARAAMQGRDYVLPDDIKALVEPVLAHRVSLSSTARLNHLTAQQVIRDILQQVPLPDRATVFDRP